MPIIKKLLHFFACSLLRIAIEVFPLSTAGLFDHGHCISHYESTLFMYLSVINFAA